MIVVVGASSGIGREIALRYAARHALLILASHSTEPLERVADECRTAGVADVIVQTTDVSDAGQVQQLFDDTVARFGRVNLLGAANVARSALIHFSASGSGHLVLIGSMLGTTAVPYQSAYVVSDSH